MDLGDIVIYGGERFYLRGMDPIGVQPRFLYLEDARTGRTVSVAIDERSVTRSRSLGGLRLVPEPTDEPSTSRS
jgi:hypothetical protein